jgi:hypothetical protein
MQRKALGGNARTRSIARQESELGSRDRRAARRVDDFADTIAQLVRSELHVLPVNTGRAIRPVFARVACRSTPKAPKA